MKKLVVLLLALILVLSFVSCDSEIKRDVNNTEPPDVVADEINELRGTVTAVLESAIEITDEDEGLYRIHLTDDLVQGDGVSKTFEVGNRVIIGYTGGVMESWPMQVNSVSVILNEK